MLSFKMICSTQITVAGPLKPEVSLSLSPYGSFIITNMLLQADYLFSEVATLVMTKGLHNTGKLKQVIIKKQPPLAKPVK